MPPRTRIYHNPDISSGKDPEKTPRSRVVTIIIIFFLLAVIAGTAVLFVKGNAVTIGKAPAAAGCITPTAPSLQPTVLPITTVPAILQTTVKAPVDLRYGQLNVTAGAYRTTLPVLVDGVAAGEVSAGTPLVLTLSEGSHTVSICSATVCEEATVLIGYAIRTTIDFEDSFKNAVPQGNLSISIGTYPAMLPVFIDAAESGVVSRGKPLNQTISMGDHTVRVCLGETCFDETVMITPSNLTLLDFGERLNQGLPRGSLRVSIGGYAADLPVSLDNTTVGVASMGKPLDLETNVGNHTVRVCSGKVCESEVVTVRFAKQSVVNFEERLKRDAEFPAPTARIVNSTVSGSAMRVNVEFINPETIEHTITTTISCVFTFTDSHATRKSDSAKARVIRAMKAGERVTVPVSLSMSGGSNYIANEPMMVDLEIK